MMDGYYSGAGTTLKFKLNLKDKFHAIQTFYVGTDDIYTIQRRRNDSDGELRDLTLSRLIIQKDRYGNPTGKAKQREAPMILVGFGHSQVLQSFTHGSNHTPYLWIATRGAQTNLDNPDLDSQDLTHWPTQLARVRYVPGARLDYTNATRLISLKYANHLGKSIGSLLRVEGALSSDQSKLLIVTINTDKPRKASFIEYDNERLNQALDEVEETSKPYLSCDSAAVRNASIGEGLRPGFISSRVYALSYYGSIQGVALDDNDDIYFLGSNTDNDGLMLSRISWGQRAAAHQIVDNSSWKSGKTEGEGIQLSGDDVLIGITSYHRWTIVNQIYSFPKSVFKT
jgi:hypothetical protein